MNRKHLADKWVPFVDVFVVIFVIPAALLMKLVRRLGLARLRLTRAALVRIGVLPILNHYYEPFVMPSALSHPLDQERQLPGIEFNLGGQLEFLLTLTRAHELSGLASTSPNGARFKFGNQSFESGDAEFLYQVIRKIKPERIVEIGSGHSTLIARMAVERNLSEEPDRGCRHVCIEPYEQPWLEELGIEVLRQRVETVGNEIFSDLGEGDLLFIDSSHVIRPQGDVVTEYLHILPLLRPGVLVHVHDIFTPRDYPRQWVVDSMLLWNEQYLLEAFLTNNANWTVIAALNMLKHSHYNELFKVCPYLTPDREPGSFYMLKC